MANQSKKADGQASGNTLAPLLLTVLPPEIRLLIYKEVLRGSRAKLSIVPQRPLGSKMLQLRPSRHHQLLLACRTIYTEALAHYWPATTIYSAIDPDFDSAPFYEVLRAIPAFAHPMIREMRCIGFRESITGPDFSEFIGRFTKLKTIVMDSLFFYVTRRVYEESDWSPDIVINKARRVLRRRFPSFEEAALDNIQVLQRVQFPVHVWSGGIRIRIGARNSVYPAKVFFINHTKGILVQGNIDTWNEEAFQQTL